MRHDLGKNARVTSYNCLPLAPREWSIFMINRVQGSSDARFQIFFKSNSNSRKTPKVWFRFQIQAKMQSFQNQFRFQKWNRVSLQGRGHISTRYINIEGACKITLHNCWWGGYSFCKPDPLPAVNNRPLPRVNHSKHFPTQRGRKTGCHDRRSWLIIDHPISDKPNCTCFYTASGSISTIQKQHTVKVDIIFHLKAIWTGTNQGKLRHLVGWRCKTLIGF